MARKRAGTKLASPFAISLGRTHTHIYL
jgi:hypothetical protein